MKFFSSSWKNQSWTFFYGHPKCQTQRCTFSPWSLLFCFVHTVSARIFCWECSGGNVMLSYLWHEVLILPPTPPPLLPPPSSLFKCQPFLRLPLYTVYSTVYSTVCRGQRAPAKGIKNFPDSCVRPATLWKTGSTYCTPSPIPADCQKVIF